MQSESTHASPQYSHHSPSLPGLFLSVCGSLILAWVAYLTWYDMTQWSKDIVLIFFGSRIGELISLGVGMKVIYYFLIGLTLLLLGLITLRRNRSVTPKMIEPLKSSPTPIRRSRSITPEVTKVPKSGPTPILPTRPQVQEDTPKCPHHLSYLANRSKDTPIPQECLTCPLILDCTRRT